MKANYDLIADEWCKHRKKLPEKDQALFDVFCDCLLPKVQVLDLGCGSGIPIAKQLVEKGFSIAGVDRSKNLLQQAKGNVPEAIFYQSEIESYEIRDTYHGVILWDVLFHFPREKHPAILQKIFEALTPSGCLILSSGGCDEEIPPFTDFMFEVEFFYDAFPPKQLLSLCKKIGYKTKNTLFSTNPMEKGIRGELV